MSSNDRTGYPSVYEYHRRLIAVLTAERDKLLSTVAARELDCVRLEGEREDWHYRADDHAKRAHNAFVQVESLRSECDKLINALHRISLGAQNSGTTKEALGKEARAAIHEALKVIEANAISPESRTTLKRRDSKTIEGVDYRV